jgi:uncharacterized membrane protein/thiol-disulfide isomerase/thioredoxin
MKRVIRKPHSENALRAIESLLKLLNIKISSASLRNITYQPEYPSLYSLSCFLSDMGIKNLGVQVTEKEIHDIPCPAIAHLNRDGGHFVVLKKVNDNVVYIDPDVGVVDKAVSDFVAECSGAMLLIDRSNYVENNIESKKWEEERNTVKHRFIAVGLLAISIIYTLLNLSLDIRLSFIVTVFGGSLSYALLIKWLGYGSGLANLCGFGGLSRANCDNVINSSVSYVGTLHLSEVGLLYFFGKILLLLWGSIFSVQISPLLFVLAIIPLPFSLISVYYQSKVIGSYCPLCIGIMILLWADAGLLAFFFELSRELSGDAIIALLFSCAIPLILWLPLREHVLNSARLVGVETAFHRLLNNNQVFASLTEDRPIEVPNLGREVMLGNVNSKIELVFIASPFCLPCKKMHNAIMRLVSEYPEMIRVKVLFLLKSLSEADQSMQMVRHLMYLQSQRSKEEVSIALDK